MTAYTATAYDVTPEDAITAIQGHSGPILLDLDETLYLRNSTEDFIDSVHPRLPALLLMRMLDIVKPWRWTGGEVTRDVWRVRLLLLCFPWVRKHWRDRVGELAKDFANLRLMEALSLRAGTTDATAINRPIVATTGFQEIVTPLVVALGMPQDQIIASRLWHFADRRNGKLRRVIDVLGEDAVNDSLVVTDSADDLDLLDASTRPLRAVWPEARYHRALSDVYLPGQYLTLIKRPNERYIWRGIVQEDFAFWVLSSIALAALPLLHVIGLAFLLLSFWTIYERGYVDNDLIAARYEKDPKLSAAFAGSSVATPTWQPWLWAIASGAIAIVLLRWPQAPLATDYLTWMLVLLVLHGWYLLYNRLDKGTRIWMFAGLQFARSAAFVAIVPVTPMGAGALAAHTLARWVPYYIYRLGGKDWPKTSFYLVRLLFFLILALLLGMTQGYASVLTGTALALLVWNIYRARKELAAMLKTVKRLDRG
ncbi:MAG: hypothetical protein GC149_15755 [Gammaproteobacteria bacterium]|nr:hypothetical protein [Gammaproteobacteria bacterium]